MEPLDNSIAGNDYEGGLATPDLKPRQAWHKFLEYEEYVKEWKDRWEYRYLNR